MSANAATSTGIYLAVGIGAGCVVVVAVLSWYFCCVRPRQHQPAAFPSHARKPDAGRAFSAYQDEPSPTEAPLSTFYVRNSDCDLGPLMPHRLPARDLELWHVLASGSHGQVFLGAFRQDTVAIKQLYEGQSTSDDVAHFVDEIITMSRFDHPRIVALVGATWRAPPSTLQLQCVMEYMDQGNLQDYCTNSTDGSFPYRRKRVVGLHVAQALAYIHAIPLVHRDLQSKNVLLDGRKGAKITDFASAKMVFDVATMTQGVGTFRWMAPEVLMDHRCSAAADVYALGVIMTEMSAYRRPYSEHVDSHGKPLSEVKIMQQIVAGTIRPTFSDTCPQWWRDWSEACMQPEPADRPTADELVRVMQAFQDPDA